jgi:pimeloyl-ACP methyl ester carboxylesterase
VKTDALKLAAILALAAIVRPCSTGSARTEAPKPGALPARTGCSSTLLVPSDRYRIPRGIAHDIVTIECDDGYKLAADYLKRLRFNARMAGVIFIHSEEAERHEFYPLTFMNAGRGFATLAPDLRGHGENPETKGNPPKTVRDLEPADWAMMLSDLHNVISHMAMKNEVDGGRLALVGSRLGANLAIRTAAEPWAASIMCVIAVSPGLDIHGVKTVDAAARIPAGCRVYLAAGMEDTESSTAANALYAAMKCPKELFMAEGNGRGAMLFGKGLLGKIQQWLTASLIEPGTKPAAPKTPAATRRKARTAS